MHQNILLLNFTTHNSQLTTHNCFDSAQQTSHVAPAAHVTNPLEQPFISPAEAHDMRQGFHVAAPLNPLFGPIDSRSGDNFSTPLFRSDVDRGSGVFLFISRWNAVFLRSVWEERRE